MSGGSLDYIYQRVENAAVTIGQSEHLEYKAFAKHLFLVSKALRAIEWEMSFDTSFDEEVINAISECISSAFLLQTVIEEAETTLKILTELIDKTKKEM